LGSARSKCFTRRSPLARGGTAGAFTPASRSTRRTVVAEVPIPKNRRITSRMRRLPACGCAACVARIAARAAGFLRERVRGAAALLCSAPAPPSRYCCTHKIAVVYGTPSRAAA
jgi:hypothetical protein